jgi:hypothetical protein
MYAVEKCKPRMGIETAAMYDAEEPFIQDIQINSTPVMQGNAVLSNTKGGRRLSNTHDLI